MIVALKKYYAERDTDLVRGAYPVINVDGLDVCICISLFKDGTLWVKTQICGVNEGEVFHYRGPAKDVKTGVIVTEKDIAIHVQKTRAFVTIANA